MSVLVRGVGDVADVGQVFESDHTADSNEQADEEGEDDADFTSFVLDLDSHEFADRKEEDHKIKEAAKMGVSHTASSIRREEKEAT